MRLLLALALLIFLAFLIMNIFSFSADKGAAADKFRSISADLDKAKAEYEKLNEEYNYYKNPANLEKEIRLRFNFKKVGEKMIILVPRSSSIDNE